MRPVDLLVAEGAWICRVNAGTQHASRKARANPHKLKIETRAKVRSPPPRHHPKCIENINAHFCYFWRGALFSAQRGSSKQLPKLHTKLQVTMLNQVCPPSAAELTHGVECLWLSDALALGATSKFVPAARPRGPCQAWTCKLAVPKHLPKLHTQTNTVHRSRKGNIFKQIHQSNKEVFKSCCDMSLGVPISVNHHKLF